VTIESSNHAFGLQGLQSIVIYAPRIEARHCNYASFQKVRLYLKCLFELHFSTWFEGKIKQTMWAIVGGRWGWLNKTCLVILEKDSLFSILTLVHISMVLKYYVC